MSSYKFHGDALVASNGKVMCKVRGRLPRKNIVNCPTVGKLVKVDVLKEGALSAAEWVLNEIQEDPGADNLRFRFDIFEYDYMSIILEFTGVNMTAEAYDTLKYGVAAFIYNLIGIAVNLNLLTLSEVEWKNCMIHHLSDVVRELQITGGRIMYDCGLAAHE